MIRRFEFTDAKSSKFWEIHASDAETVTTWGRIGTDGQTKAKEFATPAKADADMAKKIAEKIKKGYLEVGSSPAAAQPTPTQPAPTQPAPTPTAAPAPTASPRSAPKPAAAPPEPTPAPVAVSAASSSGDPFAVPATPEPDHPAFVMPSAWRKYVEPMRGHDGHARPLGDLNSAAGRALVEIPDKLLRRSRHLPEVSSLLLACSRGIAGDRNWGDKTDFGPVIDDIVERSSIAAAVAVLEGIYATAQTARAIPDAHSASIKTRLRQHLAAADDDAWNNALEVAHELAPHSASTSARMAGLFPGDAALIRRSVNLGPGQYAWELRGDIFYAVATPNDLSLVFSALHQPPKYNQWGRALPTLLDRLGTEITSLVGPWITGHPTQVRPDYEVLADDAKAYASLLAALGNDEAIEVLIAYSDNKHIAAQLTKVVEDRPHAALRALMPHVDSGSSTASLAERLVANLAQWEPGVVANEIDRFDEAAQARLRELGTVEDRAPEAPDEAVPPLLLAPPWVNRKSAAPPIVVEVEAMERPARGPAPNDNASPRNLTTTREEWLQLAQDLRDGSARRPSELFSAAPLDLILEILEEHRVADFCQHDYQLTYALQGFVRRAGVSALPALVRETLAKPVSAMPYLVDFDAVEAAPAIAASLSYKSLRRAAGAWLVNYPETATIGLIPAAIGPVGTTRLACGSALRVIAAKDQALVERIADEYGPEARAAVDQLLSDEGTAQLPKRMPKLPEFIRFESLPSLLLADGQRALPIEATKNLATMLQISSLADPYVGIEAVADKLDPASTAEWALALFDAWEFETKPSKHSWILDAQGLVGDDDTVRKLTPLIRAWPGEGGHKRAVVGLDALATIGTEFSLMQIYAISRKVKFKAIKFRAGEKIEEIANELGLTSEQLADRLVPDFDLEPDGSMMLNYGPRTFTVGFDQELKPYVRDDTGKIRKALPNPGAKDDPELAPAAKKQFAQLKKDVRAVAADNLLRLETAMCNERRWSTTDFREFFLEHPLIVHLARRLVWATYDDTKTVTGTFRVAEDGTLATPHDDLFDLGDDASIGIAHTLHLDPAVAAAWGETFADYELLQPFDQLARETFVMTDAELASDKFTRLTDGVRHPIGRFLGLSKFGWERGQPQDAGVVIDMIKPIAPGTVLHLNMDGGIWTGMVGESEDTAIEDVQIGEGQTWPRSGRTFDELSPIVRSELIRDLTTAFANG